MHLEQRDGETSRRKQTLAESVPVLFAGTVDEYRRSRESPRARQLAVCIVFTSAHAWGRLVIFRLTGNGIFVCDAGESCGQTLQLWVINLAGASASCVIFLSVHGHSDWLCHNTSRNLKEITFLTFVEGQDRQIMS